MAAKQTPIKATKATVLQFTTLTKNAGWSSSSQRRRYNTLVSIWLRKLGSVAWAGAIRNQSRDVPTPILVAKPSAVRVRGNYRLAIQSSCPLSRVPLVQKLFCCEPAANHLQCHCGLWAFLMLDAFLRRAVGFARRKPCRARRASRRLASRRRKYLRTNCPSRAASGPLQTRHAICGSTVSGPARALTTW
jgi:hypothetical protein